ncbi:MAG: T9SS type A sorting domain-containing protein [Vicingaceae bacterium]|nr:T9SS type A sorting domain-containing protein [Vicingaceae bacterium]
MMRIVLFIILLSLALGANSQDTLTVMTYNVLNYPSSNTSKADTLKPIIKHVQPDIFLINELESSAGATTILTDALNVDGVTNYLRATFFSGPDTNNMLYFNSDKLVLYSQKEIPTALRNISEYVLYYKAPNMTASSDTVFIFCYSAHLKASSGVTNEQKRNQEAGVFKNYLDSRADLENVILGGDFNLYTSAEPAYNTILNGGNVPLLDPISSPGSWNNNSSFASIHTQSTRSSSIGDGGASGGMDDRFDFIFFNDQLQTGTQGLTYVPGSYTAVGNDGNHFNQSINSGTNNAAPSNVIDALYYMSDHLPVVLKVSIPVNVGSEELEVKNNWKGFFSKNQFNFSSNKREEELTVLVYDVLGKILQTKKVNKTKTVNLKLQPLNQGVYFVKVVSETKQETFKVFKR